MYKFVQINEIIENYSDDKELRDIFSEVLALRFKGYRDNYGKLSIPIDLFDYIGTHLVIVKCEALKLTPLCCLRSITVEQAKKYQQDLPYIYHMFPEGNNELKNKCHQFIKDHSNVCYTNNFTLLPNLSTKEKLHIYRLNLSFYFNYHRENGISNFITAASDKFKVYNIRASQGYTYLDDNDISSTFTADHIMGEKFRVMTMTKFSDLSSEVANEFYSLYENRIIYGVQDQVELTKTT